MAPIPATSPHASEPRLTSALPSSGIPRRFLGVWAHPDDESYLTAGVMTRVLGQGGHATVATITSGERGFPDADRRSGQERIRVRREELDAAMGAIGVDDVRVGDIADGTLSATSPEELVGWVQEQICSTGPDVIATFGPDGGTGHPDHIAIGRATTEAWARSGIGDLWYATKSQAGYDEFRALHDAIGMWMGDEPAGCRPDDVVFHIDLERTELDRKRRALDGHASQTGAVVDLIGEDTYRRWISSESFRRPTADEIGACLRDVAHGAG